MIISKIKLLVDNPHPPHTKKLAGREGWRIRVGDYRILYTVNNKQQEVIILSVANRKDAYKHD